MNAQQSAIIQEVVSILTKENAEKRAASEMTIGDVDSLKNQIKTLFQEQELHLDHDRMDDVLKQVIHKRQPSTINSGSETSEQFSYKLPYPDFRQSSPLSILNRPLLSEEKIQEFLRLKSTTFCAEGVFLGFQTFLLAFVVMGFMSFPLYFLATFGSAALLFLQRAFKFTLGKFSNRILPNSPSTRKSNDLAFQIMGIQPQNITPHTFQRFEILMGKKEGESFCYLDSIRLDDWRIKNYMSYLEIKSKEAASNTFKRWKANANSVRYIELLAFGYAVKKLPCDAPKLTDGNPFGSYPSLTTDSEKNPFGNDYFDDYYESWQD